MPPDNLKSKVKLLNVEADRIITILQDLQPEYEQAIVPDLRNCLVRRINQVYEKVTADAAAERVHIDEFLDFERQVIGVIGGLFREPSPHIKFVPMPVSAEAEQSWISSEAVSQDRCSLPLNEFTKTVEVLCAKVNSGAHDNHLFEDASMLLFGEMKIVARQLRYRTS